jgi:LacI family transcriptional regulator
VDDNERADLAGWVRRNRLDGVVTWEPSVVTRLRAAGVAVPGDVSVAIESSWQEAPWCSGMDQNDERIGAAAVELVSSMLVRGERGVPSVQHRVLVESTWREGTTVRPRPPAQ